MNGNSFGSTAVQVASDNSNIVALPVAVSPAVKVRKHRDKSMRHLLNRDGWWYFKKFGHGHNLIESLGTQDLALAKAKRDKREKELGAQDLGLMRVPAATNEDRRPVATIGEVWAIYRAECLVRNIKVRTAAGYFSQLGNILKKVHGEQFEVEKASTALLTEDLVHNYQRVVLKGLSGDYLARERAVRTVKSTVVNARALFAKWTRAAYRSLKLPDLKPFLEAQVNKPESKSYQLPVQSLIDTTISMGRSMRGTRPDLYAVFLCCYDLGLRAGEAAALEWSWFREGPEGLKLEILRRSNFVPKWNKERRVPVSPEVWAHLQGVRRDGDDFVLPGGNASAREDLVKREFAGWMRCMGWDAVQFPKAAHELRKLMGSRWFTECGPAVAQNLLGHQTVATTCIYYAALTVQPKALPMQM